MVRKVIKLVRHNFPAFKSIGSVNSPFHFISARLMITFIACSSAYTTFLVSYSHLYAVKKIHFDCIVIPHYASFNFVYFTQYKHFYVNYLLINTVERSLKITAVLHFHITIMKKCFDCMFFDNHVLQCIHVLRVNIVSRWLDKTRKLNMTCRSK